MEERREIALFLMFMVFGIYIFLLPTTAHATWEEDNMRETIAPGYSTGAESYRDDVEGGEEVEAVEEPEPPAVGEEAVTIGESEPDKLTIGASDEISIGASDLTLGMSGPAEPGEPIDYSRYIPFGISVLVCYLFCRWLYRVLLDVI